MGAASSQGGYELIRRLASGGMGEVFIARRTGAGAFEKRLAVKLMLPHLVESPELVTLFHEEARVAAHMRHPNIVEIFDLGEADGRPFIAMQLVEGVSLAKVIKALGLRDEALPLDVVRYIGVGLCEALGYAHTLTGARGEPLKLVHRDVNPSNVLVSSQGAVLLTDFGIARVAGGQLTEPGVVRGKVAYLAPEQILHDAPVDGRVDVYAAGLTLFELITGTHPFRRKSDQETYAAITAGKHTLLRELRPDVTPALAAAVERAMSRRVPERFPDARAFREALVDGPVAAAHELATWVTRVCANELASFEAGVEEPTRDGRVTRPLTITTTGPLPLLPSDVTSAPRSKVPLVVGALVVLLTGAAVAIGVTRARSPEPQDPALVEPHRPAPVEPVVVAPPPAPVDLPPLAPPVERPAEPRLHRTKADASKALRIGFVTADATPWAEVRLDGALLDRTPFAKYPLPVGRHTLVFRGPDGRELEKSVSIAEGSVTTVRVEFPPRP